MEIASSCPFPVTSVVWQAGSGAWALTLVCKATFRLDSPAAVLADEQEPLNDEDNHWNDDPARSLVAPSDLLPFKSRADIVVVGHAFAPERAPVRSLLTSITVGAVHKEVEVFCDRWFDLEGRVHEGNRFVKMPLRYERAAGGPDSVNPVGMPFDADFDTYGRVPIPNLQPLGSHVSWRGDRFDPIGFGPIAPHWPARRGKLHRHAHSFSPRDWAKQPLPDIDFAYFNVAPLDQQGDSIPADERIALEHLHREHARFVTHLPGIHPRAVVDRAKGGREELRLVADTLWIDTDRALCTLVWRGGIGLYHPRDAGTIHVVVEGPGRAMSSPAAVVNTLPLATPALPELEVAPERFSLGDDPAVTLAPGLVPSPEETIPFVQSRWAESPYARSEGGERRSEDAGETLFLSPFAAAAKATLPFPPLASPPAERRPPEVVRPPPTPIAIVRPVVALGGLSLGSSAAGLGLALSPSLPLRADESEDTQAGLPPTTEPPAPPAMIGPLARPEMELPAMKGPPEPPKEATEVATPPRPPAPPPAPKPNLEDYTVERCAKIVVAMACRPADTAKTLEEHRLSAAEWSYVKNHWLEAIRQELGRGKNALRKRYDAAYVEQVEAERGPIGVEEYAKLTVAVERGRVAEAVAEMGLPAGAPMRIERVWTEKMARNSMLGEKVRTAVEQGRAA